MPNYDFKCNKCNKIIELFISFGDVKSDPNWNKKECEECKSPMEQFFGEDNIIVIQENSDKIKYTPMAPHAEDWKKARHAKEVAAIHAEGWHSTSELRESYEIAKEEEKKLGKKPGTLSGSVKAPATKAEMDVVKKEASKKKDEVIKRRKKTL